MFTSDRIVRGEMTAQYDTPNWDPLLELAPDHIDDFMWMFEVKLESGSPSSWASCLRGHAAW